eukprot:414772_1
MTIESKDDGQKEESITEPFIVPPNDAHDENTIETEQYILENIWIMPLYFAAYLLLMLTIIGMIEEIQQWLFGITISEMQQSQGWGNGDGTGTQYDIVAGAVYGVASLIAQMPISYIADKQWISREILLFCSIFICSLSTFFMGISQYYYQVAILRFSFGFCYSFAYPLISSLIVDVFPYKYRTLAFGIFNLGWSIGYGICYIVGDIITQYSNNWRLSWYIMGIIGIVIAFVFCCVPKINKYKIGQKNNKNLLNNNELKDMHEEKVSMSLVVKYVCSSKSLMLLFLSCLWRAAGGQIWGYQANNFYRNIKHQTDIQIAKYMAWQFSVGSSIGQILSGFMSDKLPNFFPNTNSIIVRLWILVISNLICFPFAVGGLMLSPPYCYLSLLVMNIFSETIWTVVPVIISQLAPKHMKTTTFAIFYWFTGLGTFTTVLVTPLQHLFHSYFWAIFALFPVTYGSVALGYFWVIFTYKKDLKKAHKQMINQMIN